MAQIKLDHTIVDIKGKMGGIYFSRDNSGLHIRAMPRNWRKQSFSTPMIMKNSPKGSRAAYIKSFTVITKFYAAAAISAAIIDWIKFASEWEYIDQNGKKKKLSWWQWFIKFGIDRAVSNYWPMIRPPRSPKKLPPYLMAGNYWTNEIVNVYLWTYPIEGYECYKVDVTAENWRTFYIWKYKGFWVISRQPGPPLEGHYWVQTEGHFTGEYTETIPHYGPLFIQDGYDQE